MNYEQVPDQIDPEELTSDTAEPKASPSNGPAKKVDQEMADAYGLIPQKAKALGMYL